MPFSPQIHETLNIRALRNLVDQEIRKGMRYIQQPAATRMSLSDTVSCLVLGLDVHILATYCGVEMRRGMLELAKTTPVLLTYAAGKERQEALQAVWQLRKRLQDLANPIANSFHQQPTQIQEHFLTTKVEEMPLVGPRGYAKVDYISCDVVPLVDYWPDFVRKAFALEHWRFAAIGDDDDDDDDATGCDGGGGVVVVVLEIMEGRLDLVEWLIEMGEKKKKKRNLVEVWPITGASLGRREQMYCAKERSKGYLLMEAAQMMMEVLRI
ncbi:MAG: hypothetical protein ASARMPREDX12_002496 [Alectoria sarmentosa]|nr:MAG: hypothetical protein ASARMPREDX12_002496 [Alectoria sarmentosa]